jgi:hypothetical protein
MSNSGTWMGRPIDEMGRDELAAALKAAVALLRSANRNFFMRPEVEVRDTAAGTVVARTFKWAFIPAGHLWSDEDRREAQARLDALAADHGLHGAVVRFTPDRLEVEVPRRLQIEQLLALQQWLDAEKDALDVSQVP